MAGRRRSTKRPSMFEVAELAGVSHQTVSRVINKSPDVSDATRAKVLKAIRTLDYHPSNSARSLASRRSRTIGLIAGGRNFYGPISTISAIESMARKHGLYLTVSMVHEAQCSEADFESMCLTLDEQNVDAYLFLTPTDVMFSHACRVRVDRPRVIIGSTHGGMSMREGISLLRVDAQKRTAFVGINQWGAMADMAKLVAHYGHRSALYLAGPHEWRDAATRLLAWQKASVALSMRSLIVSSKTWDASEAYARMNHVMERLGASGSSLPTVVVTANDAQAVGVARALHEHGMRIPQDISLVGFDDMPATDNMYPPLTTVRPDFEQLGISAMKETLRLLGEGEEPSYPASSHGVGLVPAIVIRRSSLGPAHRQ
ncbi:LacI family transcriptional regulator [Bifidobacterium aemilianum]|uniref:LacI family transcriptional regulator n=1 Tax=Bifidobacterium aemilianum TaxID=2493120 RepID=A0A366K6U2_9BIFI|nr:LacI family DNA-binding transcriptional regulator [Bifidobacterium aemilianum]RBP97455.1 LacI family transcriptional regulator [Bifidobacterium aemilianum]